MGNEDYSMENEVLFDGERGSTSLCRAVTCTETWSTPSSISVIRNTYHLNILIKVIVI